MKKLICLLLVVVLIFAMSVSVFADTVTSPDKDNTDIAPDDDPKSPQTGDSGVIYWVLAAMALAVGAVTFCGKKLVDNK